MIFPQPGLGGGLGLRFQRQAPGGGLCLCLGPFGLAVLLAVTPRPGSPGLGQFPRLAPDSAAAYAKLTARMMKMSCNSRSRFSGLKGNGLSVPS